MATAKEFGSFSSNPTVIGESILINGKLTGDEDLTVRGRVEGELTLTKTLIVESSGIVKADVSVRNAVVSGVVVGNISATESVELTKEGRMVGDIRSPRLIIVDGASFRGQIDMGNAEPSRAAGERPAARPATRPQVRSVPAPVARPAAAVTPRAEVKAKPDLKVAESKPLPPAPPAVALAAKKKLIIKKKAR